MADKTIKVVALTTTQQLLISEVDEVPAAVPGEPDCKLVNPFVINTQSGQTILEPWLLDITRDDILHIFIVVPFRVPNVFELCGGCV